MRAVACVATCAAAVAPLAPAAAAAVANGPMIGALTPTSVVVWLRLDTGAHVRLRYGKASGSTEATVDAGDAADAGDRTVKVALAGLSAGTNYHYEIGVTQPDGSETWSASAWFRTPTVHPAAVSFAVTTDFMNAGKASQALASAAATRPGFLAVIGDMDHSGPAVDGSTKTWYPVDEWPLVLENMRAMHRLARDPATPIGAQMVKGIMSSTKSRPQIPLVATWDDHDYCGNNSDASCPFRDQAFQAWREYFAWTADSGVDDPAGCGQAGTYQRVVQGDVATVLLLDARGDRTPPGEGTASTMLGECQLDWLIDRLRTATTTWKFILSPVTFNPGTKSYDAWGAYDDSPTSDRERLLAAIRDADVRNVVVISGDIHSGGAIDDGTHAGLPEISVPHANMPKTWVDTFCRRIGGVVYSEPGTWTLGGLVEPNIGSSPPRCLGGTYEGSAVGPLPPPPYPLDGRGAPGFVRVDATPTSATVQVLDASGKARMAWRADGSTTALRIDLQAR